MTMTTASSLLEANLKRVFNERDAGRRGQAIQELYAADATLYEQEDKYSGTEAIARAVSQLCGRFPRPSSSHGGARDAKPRHGQASLERTSPRRHDRRDGTDIAQVKEG